MTKALHREFEVCEELGHGGFGTVYRCESRSTGDSFAVKCVEKMSPYSHYSLQEPNILRFLPPHPNIIKLHDVFEDEAQLHMVMDFCPNKDLFQIVSTVGALKEREARCLFWQLMQAISHCHKNCVIHRDIKPENVLLDARSRVKLADFGLAKLVRKGHTVMGSAGSSYYKAPEVWLGHDYDEQVDVWSAGIVLYTLLVGFLPFYGENDEAIAKAVLCQNLRFSNKFLHSVSITVVDLLKRMLCKDPSRRLSADQVLRHPWVLEVV